MAKKIAGYIKLQVPAGRPIRRRRSARRSASAASTSWNSARRSTPRRRSSKGAPIPTVITVYADRSFTFESKTPPASFLLKKAARIGKGSKEPGHGVAGTVTQAQLREIAEVKMKDLNANDVERRRRSSKAPPARWASRWRS